MLTEPKNSLGSSGSRPGQAEDRTGEHKAIWGRPVRRSRENKKKWRQPMWVTRSRSKKQGVRCWSPSRRGAGESSRGLFKGVMAENSWNLGQYLDIHDHESVGTKFQPKRISKTLTIKLKSKTKREFFKTAEVNTSRIWGTLRGCQWLSQQMFRRPERMGWLFKLLKEKCCPRSMLHPAEVSFRAGGGVNTFPNQQELREFITLDLP